MLKRKIVLLILALILSFSFISCSNAKYDDYELDIDAPEVDALVVDAINYITADDPETVELSSSDAEYRDLLLALVPEYQDLVKGDLVRYRLVSYYGSKNTNSSGESTKVSDFIYIADTDQGEYTVYVNIISDDENTNNLYMAILEGGIENVVGVKIGVSGWQTVLAVLSVLSYLVIIYAIIICLTSRVRLKVLWIIGIPFQTGISITHLANTNSVMFNLNMFKYSSLTLYPSGGYFIIAVLFPVIAIIFLALKKKLEQKADIYREKKAAKNAPTLDA